MVLNYWLAVLKPEGRRDDVCRIQQRYFIYRSIFAISELCKRRVHVHCAAHHFRMNDVYFGVK